MNPPMMPPLFPRWTNRVARALVVVVPCALAGISLALMAWVRTPNATGQYEPVSQPVVFDHRVHVVGLRIDCRYCHASVERSASAGMPSSVLCVSCHDQALLQSRTLAPVRQSVATGTPLHWNRVNALPGFAYFDHSIHVNKGVGCETCHGRVDRMATVSQVAPLTMNWCVSCHRDPASALRPLSAITTMGYVPAVPQHTLGTRLERLYHVRKLTDCSVCHR